MKQKFKVLLLILISVVLGCGEQTKEPAPVPPEPEPGLPFTVYSFVEGSSARWVNLYYYEQGYKSKLLVINSDEELKKYVEGDYPPVDFTKKTLLLASGAAPNNISNKIDQSLQQLLESEYKWSIEIYLGIADIVQDWQVAILIDKLSAENKIELYVTFNHY
ncbi:MAG: hypothetical protein LBV47_04130 [Bacteroidales bacterium]|jgi:hypothetical protein|nr:hypothetical protein [Bacteroidales bacterium]